MTAVQIDNFLNLSTGDIAMLFKRKQISKLLSIDPVNANGVFNLEVKEHLVHYATNVEINTLTETAKGYVVSIKLTDTSKIVSEPYFIGIAGCHNLRVSLKLDDQYIELDKFNSSNTKKNAKWSKIAFYKQSLEYTSKIAFEKDKSQIQVQESIIDALKVAPHSKHIVSKYDFLCLDRNNPKDMICTDLLYVDRISDSEYSYERIEKKHKKVYIYWNNKMDSVIFETSGLNYSETYYPA